MAALIALLWTTPLVSFAQASQVTRADYARAPARVRQLDAMLSAATRNHDLLKASSDSLAKALPLEGRTGLA